MKIYRKKEGLFGKEKRKSKRIHTGSIADSVHCIVTEFYSGTGVRQYSAGIYDRCGVCNYRHAVFSMGAEMSMSPMGERVGGSILKPKTMGDPPSGLFLGVIITISEPDLQVLAAQVPSVPNMVLILSVAAGVGAFLVVALLRILFGIALAPLLVVFYGVIFVIARFVPDNFLAVAFDSGGVTTGPMTVPFIMALGVGISAIRNDKHAENDSFGLVALCSIGPVLAVLLLGLVYPAQGSYVAADVPEAFNSVELGRLFLSEIPYYLKEIAGSLLPIVFFLEFSSLFPFNYIKRH